MSTEATTPNIGMTLPTDFKAIKELATKLGIEKPHQIKKDVLLTMISDKLAEAKIADQATTPVVVSQDKPGRPVNPNSARQQRLAELAERRAQPDFKLGRPAQTDSERQKKLAERQAKVDAYNAQQAEIANGTVIAVEDLLPNPSEKLGRPIDPTSPRQIALREYEAKKAAGLVRKGRPSFAEQGKLTREQEAKLAKQQATVVITDNATTPNVDEEVSNVTVDADEVAGQ